MLELGLKIFIAYIVGSLNGALIVGKLRGGVDIRRLGSGNAGGTNALRTQGKTFALLVMSIDILKGALPVVLLPGLDLPGVGLDPEISRIWLALACGGAAIAGHCYPVWFDFAGGKGAATTLGVMAALDPMTLLPATVTWLLVLVVTGYVGIATIAAAISIPVFLVFTVFPDKVELLTFTTVVALFIVFTHRSNIRNVLAGTESLDFSKRFYRGSG